MPTISMFYGILIKMYREQGGKHNIPHIHAEYGEHEIVYSLDGTIIEGEFPRKQQKLTEAGLHYMNMN